MPTLLEGEDVGKALKSIREFKGFSLEEVAERTCVRRAYLEAIEQMRLEALPSRPFTIGYIRAYANALDLDGEAAVARFKRDEPAPDNGLPEPMGVRKETDPRLGLFAMAAGVILAAILIWNVVQRAMTSAPPPPSEAAKSAVAAVAAPGAGGPVALGAPLPAPVESTTPEPYETPGLAAATASGGELLSDPTKLPSAVQAQAAAPARPLPATFTPQGAVHGASAEGSSVTLQAVKGGSVIIRGDDGKVYFARQLSPGEAYRVPAGVPGLVVDVSDPAAFQVFVAGQSKGLLSAAQTPVARVGG